MEVTTPLPNQDNENSDTGSCSSQDSPLQHYVIRVTSCGKFTSDKLLEYLKAEYQIFQFVMGRENDTKNEHYHIVCSLDVSITELEVRDIIKGFLYPIWMTDSGKLPKGFGNKQYNLQVCKDLDAAVSYAVKLKEYWYEGFDEAYILERVDESFEKKKPSTFKIEYQELCNSFQTSSMDIQEFMVQFVRLKAKFGQQVVLSHAHGYAVSNEIARNPSIAVDYVETFLYINKL